MTDEDDPLAREIEKVDWVRDHSADGEEEQLAPAFHTAPLSNRATGTETE